MKVTSLDVSAYRIPTDKPEADGTLAWDSTTLVLVEALADSGERGLGFTYAAAAATEVIREKLSAAVVGKDVNAIGALWEGMLNAVRNMGRPGVVAAAISAVDLALWDLKARVVGQPLCHLLGAHREAVPVYGSGGFTTYSETELCEQLSGWVAQGITRVKMKIGKDWGTREREDVARVQAARHAIGGDAELFVDANGAYSAKQAVRMAQTFAGYNVTYFEEPVSSDHLEQLRFARERVPMDVAAGEYGYDLWYFRNMLNADAVDILQADATRCLGATGFLQAAALAYGFSVQFSAHTAPSIHAQLGCAAPQIEHVEYFYDHARIEQMLFDGAPLPRGGYLYPDPTRPGLGVDFKRADAEPYRIG